MKLENNNHLEILKRIFGLKSGNIPDLEKYFELANHLRDPLLAEEIRHIDKKMFMLRTFQTLANISFTAMLGFLNNERPNEAIISAAIFLINFYIQSKEANIMDRSFRTSLSLLEKSLENSEIVNGSSEISEAIKDLRQFVTPEFRRLNLRPAELIFWLMVQMSVLTKNPQEILDLLGVTSFYLTYSAISYFLIKKFLREEEKSTKERSKLVDASTSTEESKRLVKNSRESDKEVSKAASFINELDQIIQVLIYFLPNILKTNSNILPILLMSFRAGFTSITGRILDHSRAKQANILFEQKITELKSRINRLLNSPESIRKHIEEEPIIEIDNDIIKKLLEVSFSSIKPQTKYLFFNLFFPFLSKRAVGIMPLDKPILLYGSVGSGKSSFIRALTHETSEHKGLIGEISEENVEGKRKFTDSHSLLEKKEEIFYIWYPNIELKKTTNFIKGSDFETKEEAIKIIQQYESLKKIFTINLLDKIDFDISISKDKLSEGQRRIFSIISSVFREIKKKKKYIIFDEPFSGLDNDSIESLIDFFIEIQQKENVTIIIQTQDLNLLKKTGEKVSPLFFNNDFFILNFNLEECYLRKKSDKDDNENNFFSNEDMNIFFENISSNNPEDKKKAIDFLFFLLSHISLSDLYREMEKRASLESSNKYYYILSFFSFLKSFSENSN